MNWRLVVIVIAVIVTIKGLRAPQLPGPPFFPL